MNRKGIVVIAILCAFIASGILARNYADKQMARGFMLGYELSLIELNELIDSAQVNNLSDYEVLSIEIQSLVDTQYVVINSEYINTLLDSIQHTQHEEEGTKNNKSTE